MLGEEEPEEAKKGQWGAERESRVNVVEPLQYHVVDHWDRGPECGPGPTDTSGLSFIGFIFRMRARCDTPSLQHVHVMG